MPHPSKFLVLLLALLALTVIACESRSDEPLDGEISAITTTYPLTYMAQRIGGDRIAVTQLVKPGVEAHDFEPAPSDVLAISKSNLFVYNHPALEAWALNAASASASGSEASLMTIQTINLESAGEDHGGQAVDDSNFDAHVWLNPLKAQDQASRILAALVSLDPDGAKTFIRNADALNVELRAMDEIISDQLSGCALDSVVVSHLAFGHMAERYGFGQIGLAGLSPEFESGPAQIATVIDRINELGIQHILQEPIVSNRLAETVSAETGAELLVLHPLEVRTKAEADVGSDYFDIMKENAESLRKALQCG